MGTHITWGCREEMEALAGGRPLALFCRWYRERSGRFLNGVTVDALDSLVLEWGDDGNALYSDFAPKVLRWLRSLPSGAVVSAHVDSDPWVCDDCLHAEGGWRVTDIHTRAVTESEPYRGHADKVLCRLHSGGR